MTKKKMIDDLIDDMYIKVKTIFSYVNFSDVEIYNMIKEESKKFFDLDEEKILENVFNHCYMKVRERIVNKDYQDLNRYISNNMSISDDLECFDKFMNLIDILGECITVEVCKDLINQNSCLKNVLKKIYNSSQIITEENEKLFNNDAVMKFLDVYSTSDEVVTSDDEIINSDIDYDNASKQDFDCLNIYMKEVCVIPLLTVEEEKYYTTIYYNTKDEDAKVKLLNSNLRFVISIAKRYIGRGLPFLDLIQEGNLGLIKAIERFDPTMGYRLSTYADFWVRKSIVRALQTKSAVIKIPVSIQERFSYYLKKKDEYLSQILVERCNFEELSKFINIPLEEIIEYERILTKPFNLNELIRNSSDDDWEFHSLLEDKKAVNPEEEIINLSLRTLLDKVLLKLNESQRYILMLRYGLYDGVPKTLQETAQILYDLKIKNRCISYQSVQQAEATALKKVKKFCHPRLYDYLD